MKTIKISKKKLLHQIQKNLQEHKFIYNEAMESWQTKVRLALADALEQARKETKFITDLELMEPECHIDEYENIIERINWHEEDIIELDQREFNQFILDKWDWQYSFLTTASSYSSSSSSSSSIITRKMGSL